MFPPSEVIPVLFCANVAGIIPAIKANTRMAGITNELILEFITVFSLDYYIIIEANSF
jgi:hypothetical protein